ncbi:NTP transferase domain-containing protein [Agromyces sp. SYSU K20354]|uniref:NTP transferase domain-containing protein n=1 Tax=Agromyces cavernae TaxID=2898659 RepID=UPI001E50AE75|nr:NTP transferase domain-containing protein [Agromyces cavernae]MCD2442941.1 NTP transferase domain-containing protein [Agromyces cavernae]
MPVAGIVLDAVILAGGRSSRLGGSSKAELVVGSRRLVDLAVDAAAAVGARTTVVVGPHGLVAPPVLITREDPPFGGPVAGIAAGLAALDGVDAGDDASDRPADRWVLVLTCDLPLARPAAAELVAAVPRAPLDTHGIRLDDGRPQWLPAVYRRDALARTLAALGDPQGASMRALAEHLTLMTIADPGGLTADVDTWQDLEDARRAHAHPEPPTEGSSMPNTPNSPESLDRWLVALATELGVDPATVPVGDILDLARDVAHGVARPAAPLSTFVLGLAVGAGNGSLAELSVRTSALADGWSPDETA